MIHQSMYLKVLLKEYEEVIVQKNHIVGDTLTNQKKIERLKKDSNSVNRLIQVEKKRIEKRVEMSLKTMEVLS